MRRFIDRTAAAGAIVALAVSAVPLAAADAPAVRPGSNLTQLSASSRRLLTSPPRIEAATQPPAQGGSSTSSPGAFFKSTRGKITLAMMGAGAGIAVWSIHHDRQPVKSPIR